MTLIFWLLISTGFGQPAQGVTIGLYLDRAECIAERDVHRSAKAPGLFYDCTSVAVYYP
jgi:hypothetical protein